MIRILLSVVLMLLSIGPASGLTFYVRKSGNDNNDGRVRHRAFQTVSKAVSVAQQGDTIYIGAGTYDESITWDIKLSGPGFAMLYGDINGSFTGDRGEVVFRSPNNSWNLQVRNGNAVLVYGITFRKPESNSRGHGCLISNNSTAAYFLNCKFQDLTYGIYLTNSRMLLANTCRFDGNQFGIYAARATTAMISLSTFGANRNAVYCQDVETTQVQRCQFSATHAITGDSANSEGVYAVRSQLSVVASNFDRVRRGVFGDQLTGASISQCSFSECTSFGVHARGEKLQVAKCQFKGGANGCMLDDSSGKSGSVLASTFAGLSIGVYALGSDYDFSEVSISDCVYGIYSHLGKTSFSLTAKESVKLTSNRFGLFCVNRETNPFVLSVDGIDFSSNENGIYATGVQAQVSRCAFACTRSGVQVHNGTTVDIRNCKFRGTGETANVASHGFYVSANRMSIRDCSSENCRNGYYIINRTDVSPVLRNVVSDNTSSSGLYIRGGNWSWRKADGNTFTNTAYAVQAVQLNWAIDGISIPESCAYGILDYYGNLSISNCSMTCPTVGIYCYMTNTLKLSNSELTKSLYGILSYFTKAAKISGLTASNNTNGVLWHASAGQEPVYIENSKIVDNVREGMILQNTTLAEGSNNLYFSGNQRIGLRISNASLKLVPEMNFQFSKNNIGLYLQNGDLSVSEMGFQDDQTPIYFIGDSIEVQNCKIDARSHGIYAGFRKGCRISDCSIRNARQGLYLNPLETLDEPIEISNVNISNASSFGMFVINRVPAELGISVSNCKIDTCGEGMRLHSMQAKIRNCSIATTRQHGVRQVLGSTHVSDTTIRASRSYAIHATGDSIDLNRVVIADSNYGPLFSTDRATMVNSVVKNCNFGLYLNRADADFEILQSTFANILYYGIWHLNGNAVIRNTIVDAGMFGLWKMRENGSITHDHNLIYSPREPYRGLTADPSEINKSPVFVSVQKGDVHLAAGSPAINAGTDLSKQVATDIEGNKRPSYRGFEIGAYEYTKPSGSLRVLDWDELAQ